MKKILIVIMILSILLLTTGCWTENNKTECVKEKWIKNSGSTKQRYMVGMESGEVYMIEDSMVKWQWESSDIYNQITEGKCYTITYFWFRNGMMSEYHNILRVK